MIKLKKILTEEKDSKQEKDFEEFADTRLSGAEGITASTKEKGGLALLTWHHYKVKLPYYEKAAEGKLDLDKAREEYVSLLEQLYKSTIKNMSIEQIAFQELVGKIQVLGELLIKETA